MAKKTETEQNKILFEIFDQEGNRLEWTESTKCVPSPSHFQFHVQNGHTMKLNGKEVKTYAALTKKLEERK